MRNVKLSISEKKYDFLCNSCAQNFFVGETELLGFSPTSTDFFYLIRLESTRRVRVWFITTDEIRFVIFHQRLVYGRKCYSYKQWSHLYKLIRQYENRKMSEVLNVKS